MTSTDRRVRAPTHRFVLLRHKPPTPLTRPRGLVVACVPMRSNVNLSQIARTAAAMAIDRLIVCGNARVNRTIARDAADHLVVETRRTLPPVLSRLKAEGYRVVALEQATGSVPLPAYAFPHRTVLVVGNERLGVPQDVLDLADDCVEIPVWGLPHSYNAASAGQMAMYEYCRCYPDG